MTQLRTRRKTVPDYAEQQEVLLAGNNRGDAQVSLALPERADLVRLGFSFGAQIPTGSAFTYVAAWPTTRAELVLWNGEPSNGKTYVIDRAWMYGITSMGAAQPITLIAQVAAAGLSIAAPTDNAAVLRHNLLAQSTGFNSLGRLMVANTAFALTNKWAVLASDNLPMTTNLGAALSVECYGRYLVPPGGAFCLAGIAGTAAGTAIIGVEWHEVALAVGS